jgi:integrase
MHFNLKKHKTAGITYKDDGQIADSKIKDEKIINSNITFKKPYKLQVRASKMINGKKTIKKKTLTYPTSTTLLSAIADASKTYKEMMIEIETATIEFTSDLSADMKFCDAFDAYVRYKEEEHRNDDSKNDYDTKAAYSFYKKYLKPIHKTPLNQIKPRDITALKSKMVGKSMRYKLAVHQWTNPVYIFVNDNIDGFVKSPSKIKKADRNFENTRTLDLSSKEIKALFKRLRDHQVSPYREIYMWLMHGRRRNEVLSLEWSDINFKHNTYTIRATNNKARTNMIYKLSERLMDTLKVQAGLDDIEKMKGFVFKGIRNKEKAFDINVLRTSWLNLKTGIVMHQLRSCIVTYLKNEHNVSNDLCGFILGHKQSKTVTETYGTYGYDILNDTLNLMLDDVFDDISPIDDKLKQLQALFPDKSKERLEAFLKT